MTLILAEDCTCADRERPLVDGSLGEWYEDEGEAAAALSYWRARERERGEFLVYAVHAFGRHVLEVSW